MKRFLKCLASLLIVAILVIAIYYVKSPDGIFLPSSALFLNGWDAGYVSTRGTWTSLGETMMFPVQTSTIHCYKDMGNCIESIATFRDRMLNLSQDIYEIEQWDQQQIIAQGPKAYCVSRNTIQIDRSTKTVTAITVYKKDSDALCKEVPTESRNLLVSGDEAMRRLR